MPRFKSGQRLHFFKSMQDYALTMEASIERFVKERHKIVPTNFSEITRVVKWRNSLRQADN